MEAATRAQLSNAIYGVKKNRARSPFAKSARRARTSKRGVACTLSPPERVDSSELVVEETKVRALEISETSRIGAVGDIEPEDPEWDIFRDSILRYAGYSNEVGEAFRRFIGGRAVMLSYVVATAYCASDSIAKGFHAFHSTRQSQMAKSGEDGNTVYCVANACKAVVDTFMWQIFASVIIPGFLINRIVHVADLVSNTIVSDHDEIYANFFITGDKNEAPAQGFNAPTLNVSSHTNESESDLNSLLPGYSHRMHKTKKATHGRFEVKSYLDFFREYSPTLVGLAAIPFIVKPIDDAVDYAMDHTVRRLPFWWREEP